VSDARAATAGGGADRTRRAGGEANKDSTVSDARAATAGRGAGGTRRAGGEANKESTVPPMVRASGLDRTYRAGGLEVRAIRDVSVEVPAGDLVAITGRSGSGKTTLLNLIGGLDTPQRGRVLLDGRDITGLDEAGLLRMRRETVGFVFQSFALIPVLSAIENVGVPMRLTRTPVAERERRARLLLSLVGLEDHADQRPYELSGGQQQRVAIARALANRPRLLIADEPTGQLDSETGKSIMRLIQALVRDEGVTALVATHDPLLLGLADRVIELRDGAVVDRRPHEAVSGP
jgi:putative ABC transport system ATP-binding protein